MSIRVIIADDHALVREGIKAVLKKAILGINVIAEASNGKEVLNIAKKTPADVYLLDISMPLLNGLEVTDRLIRLDPANKIIILSMYDDRVTVQRALQSGAKGYLIKETAAEEVVRAIREVVDGGTYLTPRILKLIGLDTFTGRKQYVKRGQFSKLTHKEIEILQLVAEGFSSKDIAKELKIASATVRVHRKNLMCKLDIHKETELVRFAFKEGIIRL